MLLAALLSGACSAPDGMPASTGHAPSNAATPAPSQAVDVAASATPTRSAPTMTPEPLPDALMGAWYHPAPAFWWFIRAGSPTCVAIAHTELDCVAYQLVGQPAYVGAASMDGRILRIRWVRGYCAGDRTDFGTGIDGDTLRLFDRPDDCGGADLVMTRAGIGPTPSAPLPPSS
jgi:hypothetical protein